MDQYPSDLDDVAPQDPTAGYTKSSPPPPSKVATPDVTEFQSQPDRVFEQPKERDVLMGIILKRIQMPTTQTDEEREEDFEEDPRWYAVMLQDGRVIVGAMQGMLNNEVMYYNDPVLCVKGNHMEQWFLFAPRRLDDPVIFHAKTNGMVSQIQYGRDDPWNTATYFYPMHNVRDDYGSGFKLIEEDVEDDEGNVVDRQGVLKCTKSGFYKVTILFKRRGISVIEATSANTTSSSSSPIAINTPSAVFGDVTNPAPTVVENPFQYTIYPGSKIFAVRRNVAKTVPAIHEYAIFQVSCPPEGA